MFRTLFAGGIVCLLVASFSGCATSPQSGAPLDEPNSPEPGVLEVGVNPSGPPFIFFGEGAYQGLEAELARKLAAELGLGIRFVELEWTDLMPALEAGQIDIAMSAMSITHARAERIAFSDPYLRVGQLALVRAADADRFESYADMMLASIKVGVDHETTGDYFVRDHFVYAERVAFDSPDAAADALAAGEVDLVVHDAPMVLWLKAARLYDNFEFVRKPFTIEFLAWGLAKENDALRAQVNDALKGWRENGSLDEAIERWMPPLQWPQKSYAAPVRVP
jgi:polar amino acid transport system substrate-binding protein